MRVPSVRRAFWVVSVVSVLTAACSSSENPQSGDNSLDAGGQDASTALESGKPSVDSSTEGGPSSHDDGSNGDSASTADSRPPTDSSSSTDGADAGATTSCKAACTGKTCGDDGCGGTCGGCPPSQLCGPAQTCVAPSGTATVTIDANSQKTSISSGIYGVAFNSDDSMQIAGLNRWGGDATESYNWKIDVSNAGDDWNCANYKGRFTSPSPDPSLTTSSDQFVHYNITKSADTLMTIPITGWVASMATPNPGNPDCAGGTEIADCCTTLGTSEEEVVDQGSSVLDTSFMSDWVTHLVSTFGSAANGGVQYYQLDNEPDNWQGLRADIYPTFYPPGTWCEPFYTTNASIGTSLNQDFINRTMAYAKAVKSADPTAAVLFMSTENSTDLEALSNVECGNPAGPYSLENSLTMAILTLAAAWDTSNHERLLDCVDMHYPFPSGNNLSNTRVLWDTTSTSVAAQVQGWINSTYPGTAICVSEYNVSNDGTNGSTPDSSTGAQEADILGMYGRLGYRVAAYWTTLVSGTTQLPVYNAMAIFRNYDGMGGRFGSTSIGAASTNAGVNVYASSDSPTNPTKVWIMLVNVSGTDQTNLSIDVQNFTPGGSVQVFRSVAGAAPAADTAVTATNGSISGFSLASNSVALLVLSN
jgi:hypothetical protein